MADGKQAVAKMILVDLIPSLRRDGNDFALACAFLAKIYRSEGKSEESVRYFALSAISDIMCAVKENQSIFDLSMILYGEGDIDRAYRYILRRSRTRRSATRRCVSIMCRGCCR